MRPRVATLMLAASVALLLSGSTGCGHEPAAGTWAVPSAAAAAPGSAPNSGGPASSSPPVKPPAPAPSGGTVYVGWITSVSGGSLHIALGRHLVNSGANQAATDYLRSHGGVPQTGETTSTFVDVDLGRAVSMSVLAGARITVTSSALGSHTMSRSAFLSWLKDNLAHRLDAAHRAHYSGAPRYGGPLWRVTARGSSINTIVQIYEP
jgi:hypothetical protein